MVERLKDKEDLKLESLFRSESVPDDGFSAKVVSRVRRRMWIQRLSLPTALVVGGLIAVKPLIQLAGLVPKIVGIVPQGLVSSIDLPLGALLQAPTVILGIMLLGGMMMIGRILED